MGRKLVGEYLVERGMLESKDLEQALVAQAFTRDKGEPYLLGDILIDMGVVNERDLLIALAQQEFVRMGLAVA